MADGFELIDTKMHGFPGVTGTFLIKGTKTALVETGPKNRAETVLEGLSAAGVEQLDVIAVTHIHLDHAGAAGTLAAHFPDAKVFVHEVGAPHLVDPSKLWSSASRIYGDQMETLWGGIDPSSEDRITVLNDGDKIDLGDRSLQAIETPGHAYHHHAFLDDHSGTVFTGDALGVRLSDVGGVRPATPPPEFHLEKTIASIERIASLEPTQLCLTHFGPPDAPVSEVCDEAVAALNRWAEWIRGARNTTKDLNEVADIVSAEARKDLEGRLVPEQIQRLEQTTSYRMNAMGYMRYFDKNE